MNDQEIIKLLKRALAEIAALDELHLGWGPVIAKKTLEEANDLQNPPSLPRD